jgi:hypothetical protein
MDEPVSEELLDEYAQYLGAVLSLKSAGWDDGFVVAPFQAPLKVARQVLGEFAVRMARFMKERSVDDHESEEG